MTNWREYEGGLVQRGEVTVWLSPDAREAWKAKPNEAFMGQVARNLTDVADGFLQGHQRLVVDRDAKFTRGFQ